MWHMGPHVLKKGKTIHWTFGSHACRVPRKTSNCRGCIQFSAVLGMLDSLFPGCSPSNIC
jgi:hypothetical protein